MSIISFMSDPTAKRWRDMMRAIAAGVTGVRATEIARAALVDATKRKEKHSSSGPRIAVATGRLGRDTARFVFDKDFARRS